MPPSVFKKKKKVNATLDFKQKQSKKSVPRLTLKKEKAVPPWDFKNKSMPPWVFKKKVNANRVFKKKSMPPGTL